VPLSRELGPRLVQCGLGRGLLPYQTASSSIQPFGHNRHGPKLGRGGCALFTGGSWVHIEHKWLLDPCSRLATIDVDRKLGAAPPLLGWGAGSPSNTVAWAEAYLHTKWHLDASSRLATIKMSRKLGALSPFWGREAVYPSSTMSTGQRPTSMPSAIFIHPAVWTQ